MNEQRPQLVRKRAGYSVRALSEALNGQPSHHAIRKYEKGEISPDISVLLALTRALGVRVIFLLATKCRRLTGEFRKRPSTSAKDRAHFEAEVMDRSGRYDERRISG